MLNPEAVTAGEVIYPLRYLEARRQRDSAEQSDRIDGPYVVLQKLYKDDPEVLRAEQGLRHGSVTAFGDEIKRYDQEIAQYQLLTKEDEQELFPVMNSGLDLLKGPDTLEKLMYYDKDTLVSALIAQRTIFLSNLKLVVSVAKKYRSIQSMSLLEKIQCGNLGLDRAIARFDVTKGFKFSTYATWWIKQSIQRGIAEQSRTIRLPVQVDQEHLDIGKEALDLEQELNRRPTITELAAAVNQPPKKVQNTLLVGRLWLESLNKTDAETGTEFSEIVAVQDSDYQEDFLDRLSYQEVVGRMFADEDWTDQLEKLVLSMRFGIYVSQLDGHVLNSPSASGQITYQKFFKLKAEGTPVTISDIALMLGQTREKISKTEKKSLKRLKDTLGPWEK